MEKEHNSLLQILSDQEEELNQLKARLEQYEQNNNNQQTIQPTIQQQYNQVCQKYEEAVALAEGYHGELDLKNAQLNVIRQQYDSLLTSKDHQIESYTNHITQLEEQQRKTMRELDTMMGHIVA
jgi:chromosome segregation ATPase